MTTNETLIRDPKGGGNQSGLRDRNARVVLSFIRRHGEMPSAEIARRSGLSAQTVSNIIRALEADGLLTRGKTQKGKVGKPSTPMALNPEGVYSFGLNIGRRASELVLVDFDGQEIEALGTTYAYPEIDEVFHFLQAGIDEIGARHPNALTRITGLGVARPNKLWQWLEVVDAPAEAMRKWQDVTIHEAIGKETGLDVFEQNDATSACVAEHLLGRGREFSDFAYIFIGAFVGGGLVLDDKVVSGRTGGAAGIGPLPVPDGKGGMTQLLNVASLHVLERALAEAGLDPLSLRKTPDDWSEFERFVVPWIATTARHLATAAAAIGSVVEVEAVLIDGAMPEEIRAAVTAATQAELAHMDTTGLEGISVQEATIGRGSRSIGAALLPIHARYFLA